MKTCLAFLSLFLAAMFAWPPSPAIAGPIADDTLRQALPAPELYMKHRATLALTDAQTASVQAAIAAMNREFRELTPPLEARTRELVGAVENPAASADEVQRKLEAVLEAENRLKSARLRASLAARRALTPEQWKTFTALWDATALSRAATTSAEPTSDGLHRKFLRVRELSREVFPDGPPPDQRRIFNEAQNKMRAGKLAEAERAFDQLIEDMEKRRTAVPPAKENQP